MWRRPKCPRCSDQLRAFWNDGEKDRVAKFHQARQDAWAGIKTLLNLTD